MNFDQILAAVGGFGKYQKILYIWICLPNVLLAFHMMVSIFTGATPPHLCRDSLDPVARNGTFDYTPLILNSSEDSCSWSERSLQDNRSAPLRCVHGWVYSNETFQSTTVTEWDLVCENARLNSIGSSIYMFGLLVGSVVFGSLADRYGRRLILLLSIALQTVFGVAVAFAPNFTVYVMLRFVVGATISGVIINAFVLGTEWTCTKRRMLAGITTDYAFGLGYMMIAGIAYLIRDWRKLQLAISAPGFLLIFYIWVLPQSARWLLANNRKDEAIALLRKAALVNGRELPPTLQVEKCEVGGGSKHRHTALDLVRTPKMRKRALILFYIWFVNVLVYYGLSLGVSRLGTNLYLTQFVFGLVEIPARSIVLFVLPFSRRFSQSGFLAVGGLACLFMLAVPADQSNMLTGLAMVGKFGITASFAVVYVYTAEIFPTVLRQTGIGVSSMFARMGGVLAPIINMIHSHSPTTPLVIFGTAPVLGAVLALMLPETADKPLPDTVEDVENWNTRTPADIEKLKVPADMCELTDKTGEHHLRSNM
ncbi:solute carrier family 22 member 13 [Boleophthalmus pectinirostris]|uniref:solute carrier family 22 member 13 n=1 Tax=Boleophthalmus pectinirostris TaxID=150288 RepID=UPI000A1C4B32|nr:solute carrier family 22 member 13 [Boleophthalmus pectinirostris]